MKQKSPGKMEPPRVGGPEEESLQKLRAALSTPHGTSSEKRERILSAWSSLRSVAHQTDEGTKKSKRHRKRSRHENAEKEIRFQVGAEAPRSIIKEEKLLHDAARMGQTDRIRQLVESGIKITAKDNSGFSALHWASLYGHTEVVRTLLGLGAGDGKRINRQTDTGNTALHLACIGRHAEVAALLQLYKADEYRANLCGQTPVTLGFRELVESVTSTQLLDAAQTRRESSRGPRLHEISDWHLGRDLSNSATPSEEIDRVRQRSLRGSWSNWEEYNTAWGTFFSKFTSVTAKKHQGTLNGPTDTAEEASDSHDKIHFHDVPWPVKGLEILRGSGNVSDEVKGGEKLLLAEIGASGFTLRSLIQQERLRWHPDKFLQVFGRYLFASDRNAILAGVQTIIQMLNSLAGEDEDEYIKSR